MSVLSSVLLRQRLSDINAQPKVFHRAFFEALIEPPHDFSLDLFALYEARRRGLQVLEQPVRFEARRHGQAKGGGTLRGKWRLTRRTWAYMLELRRRLRKEGRKAEPRGSGSE
jgi:hypothetical protein